MVQPEHLLAHCGHLPQDRGENGNLSVSTIGLAALAQEISACAKQKYSPPDNACKIEGLPQ
jgi:hypothetical protein